MNHHTRTFAATTKTRHLAAVKLADHLAVNAVAPFNAAWRKLRASMAVGKINGTLPGNLQMTIRRLLTEAMGETKTRIATSLHRSMSRAHSEAAKAWVDSVPVDIWKKLAVKRHALGEGLLERELSFGLNDYYSQLTARGVIPTRGKEPVELTDYQYQKLVAETIFPPVSRQRADEILRGDSWPDRKTWPSRLAKEGYSFDQIIGSVTSGIAQGNNLEELTKKVQPLVDNVRYRAARIARTESIRVAQQAERETWKQAEDLIIGSQIHAVMDENTRPEHAERNGRMYWKPGHGDGQYSYSEFPNPPDAPNSVLPGNFMQGRIVTAARAWYDGKAVEITSGHFGKVAVTFQHPILTDKGFVQAGLLKSGDYVIAYTRDIDLSLLMKHVDEQPATIENIFRSLSKSRPLLMSPASPTDFHGEGRYMTHRDVEIIAPEWELPVDDESARFEFAGNLGLPRPEVSHATRAGNGEAVMENGFGINASASLSAANTAGSDLVAGITREPKLRRIGPAANLDMPILETSGENGTREARLFAELQKRNPGFVTLDKVTEVRHFDYFGHVYDLQTDVGYMIANYGSIPSGIWLKNCRCYGTPLIAGVDELGGKSQQFQYADAGGGE